MAVIGALVIAWSSILVRLADVSPVDRRDLPLRLRAAAAGRAGLARGPAPRPAAAARTPAGRGRRRVLRRRPDLLAPRDRRRRRRAGDRAGQPAGRVRAAGRVGGAAASAPAAACSPRCRSCSAASCSSPGALEQGAYGDNPTRGVIFGAATGLTYAGFILLLRAGGDDLRRPAGPLLDATAVATVTCVVAGLIVGDADLVPAWPAHGWLVLLADHLAGGRLAADQLVAAAPARGAHLAAAHDPADRLGAAGRADLRRGAVGAADRGRRRDPRRARARLARQAGRAGA